MRGSNLLISFSLSFFGGFAMRKIHRKTSQFWQLLKSFQWSKMNSIDGWVRICSKALMQYFRRSIVSVRYHLFKLYQLGLIDLKKLKGRWYIRYKKDKMKFKEQSIMGKYYEKIKAIKNGCEILFEMVNKAREQVGLARLLKCPPDYFGCFKELIQEYVKNYNNMQKELEPVINGIVFFYTNFAEVYKQYNLKNKYPDFKVFYQNRIGIIDYARSVGFDYKEVLGVK